jgi:hypothetical protein
MRIARTLLMLLVVSGGVIGCYKPNIGDRLMCADSGTHACPEGFTCDRSTNLCKRNPINDGGPGGMGGVGGIGGAGGRGGGSGDGGGPCLDAGRPPSCAPSDAGVCDPFCYAGCDGCRKKCSVNTAEMVTCNDVSGMNLRQLMQTCVITSEGAPEQSDNCAEGLVCLNDGCGSRCYQFCRVDGDCNNAGCTRPVGGGLLVCDVPFVDTCVPLQANTGCGGPGPLTNESCYLSSSRPTHTICDCPFNALGENYPCERSRDCIRGLTCAPTPGGPLCLRACRLDGGTECPGGPSSCRRYAGNPAGGTSHATFGFCF